MLPGRPRSVTIDALVMPPQYIIDSPKLSGTGRKPRSNSYTNLLTSTARPMTLEFAGRFKLVVLGDDDCGKTCLLNAFSRRTSTIDTALTYDEGVSTIRYGSKQVEFVIWDLSGCSEYDGLRVQLYQDTDLFLVCYDIGNEDSLIAAVNNWIPEILMEANASFILVGCKHDLRQDQSVPSSPEYSKSIEPTSNMTVSRLKAEQIAREWGAKDYIECCAKTGYNISEVFKSAAQVLLNPSSEEKSNMYGFKALSMFRRRKTNDTATDIFYSSFESPSPFQSDKFYPSYTKNYLRHTAGLST